MLYCLLFVVFFCWGALGLVLQYIAGIPSSLVVPVFLTGITIQALYAGFQWDWRHESPETAEV